MATAKKAPAKNAPGKKVPVKKKPSSGAAAPEATQASEAPDAIKLLTTDHREVKALFQQYQELVDDDAEDDEKHPIAQQICLLLTVHAQIEEEIFYPAAMEAIDESELVDEATVEHASAKDLIAQLEASDPSDDLFDAKVKVLGEYIEHHVKEEEKQMFPQARKAKLDLNVIGGQLMERKLQLMEEMGLAEPVEEGENETV